MKTQPHPAKGEHPCTAGRSRPALTAGRVAVASILVLVATGGCSSAASTPDQVLFADDFRSNARGWDLDSAQSHWLQWSLAAGKLRVTRTPASVPFAGPMRFCLPIPHRAFTDFQVTLDARSESKAAGIAYGIFVDRPTNDARYYFALDSDGTYSVFVEEHPPTLHPDFIQEPTALSTANARAPHRITVSAVGAAMTLALDGTRVASVPDAQLGPGPLGIFVEVVPGSGDETWVEFANLIVQKP